jgi:hypothetical protein
LTKKKFCILNCSLRNCFYDSSSPTDEARSLGGLAMFFGMIMVVMVSTMTSPCQCRERIANTIHSLPENGVSRTTVPIKIHWASSQGLLHHSQSTRDVLLEHWKGILCRFELTQVSVESTDLIVPKGCVTVTVRFL